MNCSRYLTRGSIKTTRTLSNKGGTIANVDSHIEEHVSASTCGMSIVIQDDMNQGVLTRLQKRKANVLQSRNELQEGCMWPLDTSHKKKSGLWMDLEDVKYFASSELSSITTTSLTPSTCGSEVLCQQISVHSECSSFGSMSVNRNSCVGGPVQVAAFLNTEKGESKPISHQNLKTVATEESVSCLEELDIDDADESDDQHFSGSKQLQFPGIEQIFSARCVRQDILQSQQSGHVPEEMFAKVSTLSGPIRDDREYSIEASETDPKLATKGWGIYSDDIYKNLRRRERTIRNVWGYLERQQTDIDYNHRKIMVNWLVEFTEEFNLHSETLFLSVAILDSYLSKGQLVKKNMFQLLGMASMLIAVKYEETDPPRLSQVCCEVSDMSFTQQQLFDMEAKVLQTMNYEVSIPTSATFILGYLRDTKSDKKMRKLSEYLLSLSLMDYDCLKFPASMISAAAILIALDTLGMNPWTKELEVVSGYRATDLSEAVQRVHFLHRQAYSRHSHERFAIKLKFEKSVHEEVALLRAKLYLPACLNVKAYTEDKQTQL